MFEPGDIFIYDSNRIKEPQIVFLEKINENISILSSLYNNRYTYEHFKDKKTIIITKIFAGEI